jgi:hypothetical protein
MNKNKFLFIALLLTGVSQSAHAYFNFSWSWGANFLAPFGLPMSVQVHAPYYPAPVVQPVVMVPVAPHYHAAPVIMEPVMPPVVYGQAVYRADYRRSRPARRFVSRPRFSHQRPRRASRGGRLANLLSRVSLNLGLNFFI